ncbi:uncharacterized protein [Anabrus simplex]|uniref:uncharacterized protein n=1 Tax=Anabrus simplex TaxID=316456 RepID=UPI0035A2A240
MNEEQINIKLMQSVEKYRIIYDYLLPGHSNKNEVDKAWHAVSKELNLNVATCKDKWRNCRNCWYRYLRQAPTSGSAAVTKKPYYLADYLAFLTSFTKSRRQVGNVENPYEEEQSATGEQPSSVAMTEENDEENSAQEIMQPLPRTRRRDTKRSATTMDVEVFSSYIQMKAKHTAEAECNNPDELFFKSLLPDVAKLSPAAKSSFKLFVQQKLNDMLYRSARNVQCSDTHSHLSTSVLQYGGRQTGSSYTVSPLSYAVNLPKESEEERGHSY